MSDPISPEQISRVLQKEAAIREEFGWESDLTKLDRENAELRARLESAEGAERLIERLAKVICAGLISEDGIEGTDAEEALADAETLLGRKLTPERCGACGQPWEECGGH